MVNIDTDSLDLVTAISCDDYNNIYLATIVDRPYAALASGKVVLSAFDSSGSEDWKIEITGDLRISDIATNDNHIFLAGQVMSTSILDGHSIASNRMFLAMLNKQGEVQWVQEHDSLEGTFSRLLIDNNSIWVSTRSQSINNYLLQVDTAGNVQNSKFFAKCIISDLGMDDNGNIYLAGTLFGNKLEVDTLSVMTPPYPNYVIKLSGNQTAVWVRFTQNVTANHFPRLEVLDDRIFTVQEIRRSSILVETQLSIYDTGGMRLDTVNLGRVGVEPHAEMASTRDAVVLQLDQRHSIDTITHMVFNRDMNVVSEHKVRCKIPYFIVSDYPYNVAANGCNFVSNINYTNDSLALDDMVLNRDNSYGDYALLRFNMGCKMHGNVSLEEHGWAKDLIVRMNPVESYFEIELSSYSDGNNLELQFFDLSGKELMVSEPFTGNIVKVDYSSIARGMYIFTIVKDGLTVGSGKIVL